MNSFDLKDWSALESVLAPRVRIDYSDLRGDPPSVVRAADYVESRAEALEPLATHHLLGNLEITESGEGASVRASAMIYRSRGTRSFHSHAFYVFALRRIDGRWKITEIRQTIFWNEGDPRLHRGVSAEG